MLLDFGLVAELEPTGVHQSTEANVLGTASYMAPEQGAGFPVSPAADWYSVGVMLYESLTGWLPFQTSPGRAQGQARSRSAGSASAGTRGSRTILTRCASTCCGTTQGRDLRGLKSSLVLTAGRSSRRRRPALPAAGSLHGPFVGRAQQVEALRDTLTAVKRGQTVALFVHGGSGVGKTALVQHFLDELSDVDDAVVLAGRCYERESVPYKALDSVVDALARYLRRLPGHEAQALLPRDILSWHHVFPVLCRVEAIAVAPRHLSRCPIPTSCGRAFRCFAQLWRDWAIAVPSSSGLTICSGVTLTAPRFAESCAP